MVGMLHEQGFRRYSAILFFRKSWLLPPDGGLIAEKISQFEI
jgi:hypothetical protein